MRSNHTSVLVERRMRIATWNCRSGLARDRGSVSGYNKFHQTEHVDEEADKTRFARGRDGPSWHIDLVFVPDSWMISDVFLGEVDRYLGQGRSDHLPVIVTDFTSATDPGGVFLVTLSVAADAQVRGHMCWSGVFDPIGGRRYVRSRSQAAEQIEAGNLAGLEP